MVIGPLIALLIIAAVALLIVRVGATALMMTGLSWDSASFQAYSAFFGVGFTTKEAEHVVNHPLRRRIIRDLILFGNVGLTSAMATVIITFLDVKGGQQLLFTLGTLALGIVIFVLLGKVGLITKAIDWSIRKGLERVGMLHVADYDLLLRVQSGFCVSEIEVTPDSLLANTLLGESRPADYGVIVLGITKEDGRFVGAPNRHERVVPGDVLLVYGNEASIVPLRRRPKSPESKPQ